MPYQLFINDVFELSGRPINNTSFQAEGLATSGELTFSPVVEPLEFSVAAVTHVRLNDSLILDGATWTVTGFREYNTTKMADLDPGSTVVSGSTLVLFVRNGTTERVFAVEYDAYSAAPTNADGSIAPTTTMSFWGEQSASALNVRYFSTDNPNHLYQAVCFATGTMIETATGPRPIERLRIGDLVMTRDHGLRPLRWLGGRRLSGDDLIRAPHLRPVRIAAGALGKGVPAQDLTVSPQHRMLLRSPIAARMTGNAEVLVAAVHLAELEGVTRSEAPSGVGYWHMMFDEHEIVFANGAEAESLYLGPMALKALTPKALAELTELFPELVQQGDTRALARQALPGKQTRKLVQRQIKNRKPLVAQLSV